MLVYISGAGFVLYAGSERGMKEIRENYGRIGEGRRRFDVSFWQSQGGLAIFEAARRMSIDYYLLRGEDVSECRLQRTVESFRRA